MDTDVDDALVVFTTERAAAVTGLSERQIAYWRDTELVTPTVDARFTPRRPVRLYSFVDVMSLLTIAELRGRDVSLQRIRRIVAHLRRQGYAAPLVEVVFGVQPDSNRWSVYYRHADGSWEGERHPGQLVMRTVIHLDELRARVRAGTRRDPASVGQVERRRGALGSKPVLKGTRVPVSGVKQYLARGAATAEILAAYPILQPADVEVARNYVA